MALLNREKQAAVQQLPIGEITPSPHQTRRDFHEEELAALAQSIDRSGLLNPISVRALPQGGYCLIAGERRWRACQMLGWSRIPALVWQKDDAGAAALTLAENLHRSDLHYIEEAEGILRLIAQCGLSQNEAAALLAMSPSALCNKLRLLRLAPPVIDCLRQYGLTERHARTLLRLTDPEQQLAAARHMGQRGLNVAQAEQYVDALTAENRTAPPQRRPTYIIKDVRLFLNSVERGVRLMQSAGVGAEVGRRDTEEEILLTIHIPKRRPAAVVTES